MSAVERAPSPLDRVSFRLSAFGVALVVAFAGGWALGGATAGDPDPPGRPATTTDHPHGEHGS